MWRHHLGCSAIHPFPRLETGFASSPESDSTGWAPALSLPPVRGRVQPRFKLRLARYAARLEKSGGDIGLGKLDGLTPEALAALPVLALRLERPGDEAIALPSRDSEGVASGMWDFSTATREPGAWLIYPGAEAALPFRPTLWTVAGEVDTDSPLAQAIGIADPGEREAALDQVVAAMAADFLEPCWLELERLAGQIGHLPLTTLDLWRRLARSPQGMAALALRFGTLPQGFLDRFEQELPFAWETISFVTWRRAMEFLLRQCKESFGDDAGAGLFPIHLDARIKDLSANHGALAFLLGIASADFLPDAKQKAQLLAYAGRLSAHGYSRPGVAGGLPLSRPRHLTSPGRWRDHRPWPATGSGMGFGQKTGLAPRSRRFLLAGRTFQQPPGMQLQFESR